MDGAGARAWGRGVARSARWVAGVIVLGCGGGAGTGEGDDPDRGASDAPNPAVAASLTGASECVWVKVSECRSSVGLGDWCGSGFYAATLQSCADVGGSLSSVTDIYASFRVGGCSPCVRQTMNVSAEAVECCPDGVPGTAVPE
jgi:hypothetical protein